MWFANLIVWLAGVAPVFYYIFSLTVGVNLTIPNLWLLPVGLFLGIIADTARQFERSIR